MARDFAFNAASRAKLQKDMLHKMAVNAKKARDDLNKAMRKTQERMAKQASLANRRYKATLKRDKKTDSVINKDKKRSARALKMAVSAWQKSTSAWASATNARIDRLNKHVAANAAQIKENAKKARKDLEVTMHKWDNQVADFRSTTATARSKLSEQFAQQDKATRAWANNKIKGLVASNAAQFNDIETKMSKQRHEIDMALKQATMRFMAALNTQKALENKRFASEQADIAAAKREAKERVDAATSEFKVSLLTLSSTVKEQVQKVNTRIDDTADVVRSDAAAQAKVNANVNAEMTRMVKLGNDRYKHHLKQDMEMQKAIGEQKESDDDQLTKLANEFNSALAAIRKDLAADRKHSEDELTKKTNQVWTQLHKNADLQDSKNAEMAAATRRMKLDAMDNIRRTKEEFRKKIADLGTVVAANDKKADKKIEALTGVVAANAVKAKKGREQLAAMEEANKSELKSAIKKAIDVGEKRAQLVEERGDKMDADTKWLINNKINTEISKLKEETNASVEKLALLNKEARAELRKEMLYAIRSQADIAKNDLENAVKDGVKKMIAFEAKAESTHAKTQSERDALKAEVAANAESVSQMISDVVATDAQAQLSLRKMTAAKIKKTNTQIDAYSQQMKAIAVETRKNIASVTEAVLKDVDTAAKAAAKATEGFTETDKARQKSASDFLAQQLKIASEESEKKFGDSYGKLADDMAEAETTMGGLFKTMNDALAKQAALNDARFGETVTDVKVARKEAEDDVQELRKDFTMEYAKVIAEKKAMESMYKGLLHKVTGEVSTMKATQIAINRRVDEDLEQIQRNSNSRFTESKRARGVLRKIMDDDKAAAAEELKVLSDKLELDISKLRATNAHNKVMMAKDLTSATEKFYETLAGQVLNHIQATDAVDADTAAASAKAANKLQHAKDDFDNKIVMLTNTVQANAKHTKDGLEKMTGVVNDYSEASAQDRALIKKESEIIHYDLQKALDRAISDGEAKAKAVEERISSHLDSTQRYLVVELTNQVEQAADNVLKIIEGKRSKIADNYLSLKAYAVASEDAITEYVTKGQGRGLSSIGDLLVSVGAMGDAPTIPAEGLGDGGDSIPEIFSGDIISVSTAYAPINALVNEYTDIAGQVSNRWPMGLGKYLMSKLEASMSSSGVLMVAGIEGKNGNFVYMNGHSVGLSNKLDDFSNLATRMTDYEAVLSHLTAKLTTPAPEPEKKIVYAPPPEWIGD